MGNEMAHEKALWQIDIVHVKTEHFFDYIKIIPSALELMKKHGAHPLNQFYTEAGGAPEVVFITTYDSFETRDKIMMSYLKDAEFQALFDKASKCVYCVENYVCFPDPEVGIHPPSSSETKRILEMFKMSSPVDTGHKFNETMKWWSEKMGPENAYKPLAILHPVFFSHQCINETYKDYGMQSLRLLNPISNLLK